MKPAKQPDSHAIKLGTSMSNMTTKCGVPLADKRLKNADVGTTLATVTCAGCRNVMEVENELATLKRGPVPDELEPYYQWALAGDSGLSSKTMVQAITGARLLGVSEYRTPRDPSDFGRCYRMLRTFPALRLKLHTVAEVMPEWRSLIDNWDELEALYEAALESGTGMATALYARMKQLEGLP